MKKFFAIWLLLLALTGAARSWGEGSSVGNFKFHSQILFDFRIGDPTPWSWQQVATAEPHELERWRLSNLPIVNDPAHESSLTVSFLNDFPAGDDQELQSKIKELHPDLNWQPLADNVDFPIGFVSNQVMIGTQRSRSFEYYFSKKTGPHQARVIRIEAIRDDVGHGAADIGLILDTARRPSGAPKLIHVSMENMTGSVKVGSTVCYRLEVDVLHTDFDEGSLQDFQVHGTYKYWSLKTVTWLPDQATLRVCLDVDAHFATDGLLIDHLSLSSPNGLSTSCLGMNKKSSASLVCAAASIDYLVPAVDNPAPATKAPRFKSISIGRLKNTLHLVIDDALPIVSGEIEIDSFSHGTNRDSQILYEPITNSEFDFAFDAARLPAGATNVHSITLVDQVGNASRLQVQLGDKTYTYYSTDGEPTPTSIEVLSLWGDVK